MNGFVLPDADDKPTGFSERLVGLAIPADVAFDFFFPPAAVPGRRPMMLRAAVPEAAIHHDGDARWAEDDVSGPAHRPDGANPDAIAQAPSMEGSTEPKLRFRITVPDLAHARADDRVHRCMERTIGRGTAHTVTISSAMALKRGSAWQKASTRRLSSPGSSRNAAERPFRACDSPRGNAHRGRHEPRRRASLEPPNPQTSPPRH